MEDREIAPGELEALFDVLWLEARLETWYASVRARMAQAATQEKTEAIERERMRAELPH